MTTVLQYNNFVEYILEANRVFFYNIEKYSSRDDNEMQIF